VRTRAEVDEFTVLVERDFFAFRNIGEPAEFVALLTARLDDLGRFVA